MSGISVSGPGMPQTRGINIPTAYLGSPGPFPSYSPREGAMCDILLLQNPLFVYPHIFVVRVKLSSGVYVFRVYFLSTERKS